MDGLIPFLFRAIKKQQGHGHTSYRSLSEGSTRSYHQLVGRSDSFEGSSHRRTRSEFQAPAIDFLEQRPGNELRSRSMKVGESNIQKSSAEFKQIGSSYPTKYSAGGNNVSRFR